MSKATRFWERRTVGPVQAIHPLKRIAIQVDPQRDARIGTDLGMELRRLPGLVSWYAALRDTAETVLKEAKHIEHNTEEDLYAELRAAPLEKGAKRITETELKMAVRRHPRMRDAFRTRMAAEEMLRHMRSAVDALHEKRWVLMSLTKWRLAESGTRDHD